eukprot:gene14371-16958_t
MYHLVGSSFVNSSSSSGSSVSGGSSSDIGGASSKSDHHDGEEVLAQFSNQVGGHCAILSVKSRICKPLIARELQFYTSTKVSKHLTPFVASFHGTVDILKTVISPSSQKFMELSRKKIKSPKHPVGSTQQYILLEDLTRGYQHPCIVDIKVGTRQKGAICASTTSTSLGIRVCGMRVYNQDIGANIIYDRFYGRSLTNDTLEATLYNFFSHNLTTSGVASPHSSSRLFNTDLIESIMDKLEKIKDPKKPFPFRLYSSSLLIVYEGAKTDYSSYSSPPSPQLSLFDENEESCPSTFEESEEDDLSSDLGERESDQFDVVIVGAGPSGLSAAIRLKQLANDAGKELRVCVVEKGAEVGSHILSGAVLQPTALNELIPDWKEKGAPLNTPVTEDKFYFMTDKWSLRLPTPRFMHNEGNYIISLGNFIKWMGQQAEDLGVEIYPGFAAAEVLYDEAGAVKGVATSDMGIGKDGNPTSHFTRGMELHARCTLFAEGCRGSLTKTLFRKFGLDKECEPQTFGLGIKELWQIKPENHKQGLAIHTLGFPLDMKTYGGSFVYHLENNQMALGLVVGLDYENPYLNPYQEFQKFKLHPLIKPMLEGATCLQYGARTINEGGLQSIPKLIFPGGALIGCTAGFVNVPKVKGNHNAMKTGMLAAESAFEQLTKEDQEDSKAIVLADYPERIRNSWVHADLHEVRNFRPSFHWGMIPFFLYGALDMYILRGKAPFTLKHAHRDNETLKPAAESTKLSYPKPDGVFTFDLMTSVSRSGTNHEENQPAHLKVRDQKVAESVNRDKFDGPEGRFCPAGVYEWVEKDESSSEKKLVINAQNCLHCKTCDIKDPTQNIDYTVPEGGGGPSYSGM